MSRKQRAAQARLRVELIVKVRSGLLSASEAAKQLGVSRKTYYKYEKRFLSGGLSAVEDQEAGRPTKKTDPEKEQLKKKVEQLEKEMTVLKQTMQNREPLQDVSPKKRGRPPKKKRRKRRRSQQGELDLGSEPKCRNRGVSGHGVEADRDVQGHSGARGAPDEHENAGSGAKPGSVLEPDGCSRSTDRTAKKKSGEDRSGQPGEKGAV